MSTSNFIFLDERIEISGRKGKFFLHWKIERGRYGKCVLYVRTMRKGKGKLMYKTSCVQYPDSIANALERVAKHCGKFYYINEVYYMDIVDTNREKARQQIDLPKIG